MHVGPGAARGELAVAEGAGAPFAEEVVAFGVERPALVEAANVGDPILDGPAALQDQRAIAVLRQQIAGEEAGRSRADDHRPMRAAGASPAPATRIAPGRKARGPAEARAEPLQVFAGAVRRPRQ